MLSAYNARRRWVAPVAAIAIIAALFAAGCSDGGGGDDVDYSGYLFMTDTNSGKVYAYNPSTGTASSTSVASTGQSSTGEIVFYGGIGYACVGYGTNAGLYYFDPSATSPSFTKIGSEVINAQDCVFVSATKAYVTVATDNSANTGALYSFNPSSPSSGLTKATAVSNYAQNIILGSDGYLYVALYYSQEIVKIDPSTDNAVTATYPTSTTYPTGLCWGSYNGSQGVFIANAGGSLDFVKTGETDGTTATSVASALYPCRVLQLSSGKLVTTGYGATYIVTLNGTTASATEVKSGASSFGYNDIACKDGLVYVPVGAYATSTSKLYVFDASGAMQSYSPLTVMSTGTDCIANIGFYE
jgi:hypothetical protein